MDFIKEYIGIIGLFFGGLAGAALTGFLTHRRRDKFILGRKVTRRTIITKQGPDFTISFKGQNVQRLDQQEIVLKNIGNKVIEDITIVIEMTGNIIEKKIDQPEGSTFSLKQSLDNTKNLLLKCDYINPKDVITIQITEADSDKEDAKVIARAKNLVVKEFSPDKKGSTVDRIMTPIVSFLLLLIIAAGISDARKGDYSGISFIAIAIVTVGTVFICMMQILKTLTKRYEERR